tara:strand:+ start:27 stop:425 length:399 start_codon:yes stop_codon:yes gene_type:complete
MVESPPRLTDPSGHDAHAPPVRYWVVVHDATAAVHIAAVSILSVHDVAPDTVYPESHSGWHVEPLARVSVQVPAAPLSMGTAASHSFAMRDHAGGGPSVEEGLLAYLACQAKASSNIKVESDNEVVSQPVTS